MTNNEILDLLDKVEALRREMAPIEDKAFNLSNTTTGDDKNFSLEALKIVATTTTKLIALETKMVKFLNRNKK